MRGHQVVETPLLGIVGRGTEASEAAFNPLTGPMDSTALREVLMGRWLQSSSLNVCLAIQYSDDGVDWSDDPVAALAGWDATAGWAYDTGYNDIFGSGAFTPRLFVRFGLLARNTSSLFHAGSAVARLRIITRPVVHQTIRSGFRRVHTGSGDTNIFNPMTAWMPAGDMSELRATWELAASAGSITAQPAFQTCDNPEEWDDTLWETTFTAFGSSRTTEGVTFGEDFESQTLTRQYVRFGIQAKRAAAGIRACRASLRVDARTA